MKLSQFNWRLVRLRQWLRDRPTAEFSYRVGVAIVGVAVLAVGIVAIPYPGPGWAIVFLGLGILATEFDWARRLLGFARKRYDKAMAWFSAQGLWVQLLGAAFTCAIVLGTLWLLGTFSWAGRLVGIDYPWLKSPIGVGS